WSSDVCSSDLPRFEKLNMIRGEDVVIKVSDLTTHITNVIQSNGGLHGRPPIPKTIKKLAKDEGWWMTERNKLGPHAVILICSSRELSLKTPNEICHNEASKLVP